MGDPVKMDIVWMIESNKVSQCQIFLYNSADHSEARLDWYRIPDGSIELYAGEAPSGPRYSVYLVDQVRSVEECTQQQHKQTPMLPTKHILKINYLGASWAPLKIAFQQKEDLKSWIEALKKALDLGRKHRKKLEKEHKSSIKASSQNGRSDESCYDSNDIADTTAFEVDVDSTAASLRNGVVGNGTVIISNNHVTLLCRDKNYFISWNYKHVRRFGYSASSFLLEGGHKSGPKGEGLFMFSNCEGFSIRECIKAKTSVLQTTRSKPDGDESSSGDYTRDTIDKLYSEVMKFHCKAGGKAGGKADDVTPAQPLEAYFTAAKEEFDNREKKRSGSSPPRKLPPPSFPKPALKPSAPPEKPPHMQTIPTNYVRAQEKLAKTPSKMSDVLEALSSKANRDVQNNPGEYSALSFCSTNAGQTEVQGTGNLYGEALCQQSGLQKSYYNLDSEYSQIEYHNEKSDKKSKSVLKMKK